MGGVEIGWRVPLDHPAFAGHFPGRPIVPGVVLLDHAVLMAQEHWGCCGGGWLVTQVKFLSPCGPGDDLVFAFHNATRGALAFTVRCAERDIATGSLQPQTA